MDEGASQDIATDPLLGKEELEDDNEANWRATNGVRQKVGRFPNISPFLPWLHALIILLYTSFFLISLQRLHSHDCDRQSLIHCKPFLPNNIEHFLSC